MDKLQKNSLTIVAAVAISVVSVWGFGLGGKNIETVTKEVVKEIRSEPSLGALAGPDIISNYISWGGQRTYRARVEFTGATNTPCIITSPAGTSTLVNSALQINNGSSTASVWFMSKGTGVSSATTVANRLNSWSLASAARGTLMGTTTGTGLTNGVVDNALVLSPNQKIVWTGAGYVPADETKFTGSCYAEFQEM